MRCYERLNAVFYVFLFNNRQQQGVGLTLLAFHMYSGPSAWITLQRQTQFPLCFQSLYVTFVCAAACLNQVSLEKEILQLYGTLLVELGLNTINALSYSWTFIFYTNIQFQPDTLEEQQTNY
jgi:hypothetical protein